MESEKGFYTVPEVAKILRMAKATVYRYIRTGVIPSVTIGSKILVSKQVIEDWHKVAMGNKG